MAHKESDNRYNVSGRYYYRVTGVTKEVTVKNGEVWVCDDVDPGWGTDNAFTLVKTKADIGQISGAEYDSAGDVAKQFWGYPVGYRPIPPSASHWPLPSLYELHNLCVAVAARTSPNRSSVSVPTALGEMRDLPSLIQNAGHRLLKAVAAGWLSWRFALKPMISDLRKLSLFTATVQKRFQQLERLSRRKYVTGWMPVESKEEQVGPTDVTIHSEGASVTGKRTVTYKRKAWASIRWKLLVQPPLDVKSRYDLAERLVTGITCYGALQTAWELQPWSWLVDWFWNVGEWLQANNNTVPAIAAGFCYMCTDTSLSVYTDIQSPTWVTLDGWPSEGETRKVRIAPGTSPLIPPVPCVPVISAGQASILAALALLKMRPIGRPPASHPFVDWTYWRR